MLCAGWNLLVQTLYVSASASSFRAMSMVPHTALSMHEALKHIQRSSTGLSSAMAAIAPPLHAPGMLGMPGLRSVAAQRALQAS